MSITRASQHRQQLTEAAIEVMLEAGLEAATTRRITEQAGVSRATFHYVFESKDELLASVIDAMAERAKSALRSGLQEGLADADIKVALPAMLHRYWDFVEADLPLQITQLELTLYCLRHPELRWLAQRQHDIFCAITEEALTVQGARCRIGRAAAARLLVGGIDGLLIQFLTHRDEHQARRDLGNLATVLQSLFENSTPT